MQPGTGIWLPAAKKIEHFFVNAAIWLAPPAQQAEMRAAAWWPILQSDAILESVEVSSPLILGRLAYDALGRYAPKCAVFQWIWDLVPIAVQKQFMKLVDEGDPPPLFEYVVGVATRQLIERFGPTRERFTLEAPAQSAAPRSAGRSSRRQQISSSSRISMTSIVSVEHP